MVEETVENTVEKSAEQVLPNSDIKATRKDIHLPRRLFHMSGGLSVGLVYHFLLTHERAIHILGTVACILYVLEQVRINYPNFAQRVAPFSKYIFRAEEQLKESAGMPMLMGYLLTIITFPKEIALTAIYTLAIADPLSAIIGIRFGKTRIVPEKSLEGSTAFFICCFSVAIITFYSMGHPIDGTLWMLAFVGAVGSSALEMLPLKIDDNLTIPLFTSFWFWILVAVFGYTI